MRIALDAMGGDYAPEPIVAGAVQAVAADPELRVILVGDQARIDPLLASADNRDRLEVFHCSQAIGMEESAVVGLRKKPDNSISRSWQLLAQRKADGVVSAGNTGAMVAGGLRLTFQRLPITYGWVRSPCSKATSTWSPFSGSA